MIRFVVAVFGLLVFGATFSSVSAYDVMILESEGCKHSLKNNTDCVDLEDLWRVLPEPEWVGPTAPAGFIEAYRESCLRTGVCDFYQFRTGDVRVWYESPDLAGRMNATISLEPVLPSGLNLNHFVYKSEFDSLRDAAGIFDRMSALRNLLTMPEVGRYVFDGNQTAVLEALHNLTRAYDHVTAASSQERLPGGMQYFGTPENLYVDHDCSRAYYVAGQTPAVDIVSVIDFVRSGCENPAVLGDLWNRDTWYTGYDEFHQANSSSWKDLQYWEEAAAACRDRCYE